VRLTIEPIDGTRDEQRRAALQRLFDHIKRSNFRIQGRPPSRDELYDRF
jgi:Ribonuclease G/E